MEKFAGYGFNKSHSAAYALLSYQTAWLKAHYPAEFMAAVLSSDMDNTDKVVNFTLDAEENGLIVEPPDINVVSINLPLITTHRHLLTRQITNRILFMDWVRSKV